MATIQANQEISRERSNAARVPVFAALFLIVLKLFAVVITGSLAILASLFDSVLDLAASSINTWALRHAETPPDQEHRFGHGKAESIASMLQAALILGSAAALVWQACMRFIEPREVHELSTGLAVMLVSLFASALLSMYLIRMGKRFNSLALKADAQHYLSDVISNSAIILALLLISVFQWHWIDSIICLIAAIILMRTAYKLALESLIQLMDQELPEAERKRIAEMALNISDKIFGIHELRTRQSGSTTIVQLHLEIDSSLSFVEAHDISALVQKTIEANLAECIATIHADPYDANEKKVRDLCRHDTLKLEGNDVSE
ncbi:MAG: cation diffusion facilitator family transporter [Myxococcota bacterium]|jgi:ferrous-iron efflux pump FieF|nr:cation diffusion facilitator family transporter [Myxococcota bacterium]